MNVLLQCPITGNESALLSALVSLSPTQIYLTKKVPAMTAFRSAVSPEFVTPTNLHKTLQPANLVSASLSESKALPLEWILGPKTSLAAHVVAYLIVQEAKEVNPHLRDDLRISQLTLIHLERGDAVECSAFVLATYEVLGCHPDQVWSRILARRAANLGRAGAGERSSSHMNMLPGLSKKPVQSIGGETKKEKA